MCVTCDTYDTKKIPSYKAPCNTNFILVTLIYYICYKIFNPPAKINPTRHAVSDRARPVYAPLRATPNRRGDVQKGNKTNHK